ncbi:MAG TPA: 16S rRNA (cytosine(1402)-N(4))-methyltransferase RsmH [Verrucomicrobiae bacterium]|jgi:16S rRNA (cytosine1402-N4)-methyltransferase|nr:16S rRNA (cytosine(1402)-N(4))-methyltransferase RsmH [Verrucomicrobiae bacterium]
MHQNKHQNKNQRHVSVLLNEVLTYLAPQQGESYLDLTAGYGGHATAVLERTKNPAQATLVDRDDKAIQELKKHYGETDIDLRHQDFLSASQELASEGRQFDLILADLGVSSPHLNEGERGFAIQSNGPLDMRMDTRQALTAGTIVNGYDEAKLASLLREYGEEPKARQIVKLIVQARPLDTTGELARVIARAWPGHSRVHPATRSFQALRIAVNDELGLLERSLPLWLGLLKPGGRIVVISFHSLEDRLVKLAWQAVSGNHYDAELRLLTKRPVTANHTELVLNPRARSAKLRAAVKINITEREH